MRERGRAAVLGRPVSHSLSPVLHRAAYAHLGLDWTYEAIDCGVDELAGVLAARTGWAGFSCTMPLKRAALALATRVEDRAAAVGSANTLLSTEAGWVADNTDVAGVLRALAEHDVRPGSVTLLGAGGTAQAVLAALGSLGIDRCQVLVRDESRAAALFATADRVGIEIVFGELGVTAAALAADLVVSTLPAGAADPLADRPWRPDQTVLDVVYDPWPTTLARRAAASGVTVVSGALMLLHQAAVQVELMTGHAAPVAAMRAALRAAAPGCGA